MKNIQFPEPKYRRGQVVIWAVKNNEGKVTSGGFGKVISGAYYALLESDNYEWRYYTVGDSDGVLESNIIGVYEEK